MLLAYGIVARATLAAVQLGLGRAPSANGRVLFLGFASDEFALGTRFDFVFPEHSPGDGVATEAVLMAVTQQWGKPFDAIPSGWKTISLIEFPQGVPELIDALPVVSSWDESNKRVCLATASASTLAAGRLSALEDGK